MKKIFTTNSFEETQKIAEDIGRTITNGTVLCLYGDLGYGKTTFIQGLAKGLGVTGKIISPTFIIMRSYTINKPIYSSSERVDRANREVDEESSRQVRTIHFYHVDLYRINSEQEIIDLGLLDIMSQSESIVAIEWPEKMGNLLPEKRIDIHFEYIDEDKRTIRITQND